MSDPYSYPGRDLESMAFAVNYHRWIVDELRPFLGSRVVEVGAGAGSFTALLHEIRPLQLDVVEPSPEMFPLLSHWAAGHASPETVQLHNALFTEVAEKLAPSLPESVLYINVLEHVADDVVELDIAYRTLAPGGRVCVFVPALPFLYGRFDARIGHLRRYRRRELVDHLAAAGFEVELARYFDIAGILPWWIKYRLLRSATLGLATVRLYDRFAVPVIRRVERRITVPLGKNLLCVGRKPLDAP